MVPVVDPVGGAAPGRVGRRFANIYGQNVELVEADEGARTAQHYLPELGRAWTSVDEACAATVRVRAVLNRTRGRHLMDERYQNYGVNISGVA